jgi:hypothetical protein
MAQAGSRASSITSAYRWASLPAAALLGAEVVKRAEGLVDGREEQLVRVTRAWPSAGAASIDAARRARMARILTGNSGGSPGVQAGEESGAGTSGGSPGVQAGEESGAARSVADVLRSWLVSCKSEDGV